MKRAAAENATRSQRWYAGLSAERKRAKIAAAKARVLAARAAARSAGRCTCSAPLWQRPDGKLATACRACLDDHADKRRAVYVPRGLTLRPRRRTLRT